MADITHARLLEALRYHPETGEFFWRIKTGKSVVIGKRAGSVDPNGFRYVRVDKKDFLAQRLAWFYVHGEWPAIKLRHDNGDRDDNRIANIIEVNGSGKFKGEFDFATAEGRSAYLKAHREANPDHYRQKYLRRDFGIDLAEYQRMFVDQRGVCAICQQPETAMRGGKAKWMAVDHDHATGAIRSLLCSACNQALGHMKDDPVRLRAAADYLEAHVRPGNVVPLKKDTA